MLLLAPIGAPFAPLTSHIQKVIDLINQLDNTPKITLFSFSHQDPIKGILPNDTSSMGITLRFII
ncbi:hypothetical protein HA142_06155 [Prochlorococcus marinus str. XMU1401]|uniref:Uncharacterized protein n=1 Tax=Prochlorococcus marinus str. XMU1401 TaxID=2052594 RepID=A0A8I1X5H9_PROMR|nr:hypothetical protein [Prochlorococcus marinus]MBO8223092.1 hypothetical protein [Prochlorococcus marinus str. XMU1401]MBW3059634.1 hypothetical protein [Prochlorococcus marinus str. XMU1401E]MCQ9197302.1 hypothetical protein [Prochlorococcus marinus XMU1429]